MTFFKKLIILLKKLIKIIFKIFLKIFEDPEDEIVNQEFSRKMRNRMFFTFHLFTGLLLSNVLLSIVAILMPEIYSIARLLTVFIGLTISAFLACLKLKSIKLPSIKLDENMSRDNKMQGIVSIMYCNHIQKNYLSYCITLISVSLAIEVINTFVIEPARLLHILSIIPFFYCFFLLLRVKLVRNRVSNGLFGKTASESKELITFILSYSKHYNFTDSNGKPFDIFLPEKLLNAGEFAGDAVKVPVPL